jgi:hypothetical protein
MKRKISIFAALTLLVASSAFAGNSAGVATSAALSNATGGKTLYGDKTTATVSTAMIGKSSTGCSLAIYSTTLGYGLTTQHVSGTKAFGTSHDSTAIYSFDVTATKGVYKLAPGETGSSQFSAWSTM